MRRILPLLLLAGCVQSNARPSTIASPQTTVQIEGVPAELRGIGIQPAREQLPISVAAAWAVLPRAYEELGITPSTIDSTHHVYGSIGFTPRRLGGEPLDRYFSCGTSATGVPLVQSYLVTMNVVTALTAAGGGTRVETLLTANARPRGNSGDPVSCGSTGRLEAAIVRRLQGAPAAR